MSPNEKLTKAIEALPADDYATGQKVCDNILAGGVESIRELLRLVGEPFGDAAGAQAKYAVHGLAHHASRPGAAADRKLLAETLAAELAAEHSADFKEFVVRQLQLCGRRQEVPALAALLDDERLCSTAAQALVAVGGDEAVKALRAAAKKAEGPRQTAIDQALAALAHR